MADTAFLVPVYELGALPEAPVVQSQIQHGGVHATIPFGLAVFPVGALVCQLDNLAHGVERRRGAGRGAVGTVFEVEFVILVDEFGFLAWWSASAGVSRRERRRRHQRIGQHSQSGFQSRYAAHHGLECEGQLGRGEVAGGDGVLGQQRVV